MRAILTSLLVCLAFASTGCETTKPAPVTKCCATAKCECCGADCQCKACSCK